MPSTKQFDLSEGKFAISLSDLIKLIGAVLAIGVAYAMASSRLSLIEKGIRDGQETSVRIERRVDSLEQHAAYAEAVTNDSFHEYDLRLQSLEESLFGESRAAPRRATTQPRPQIRRRPNSTPEQSASTGYSYIPPTVEETDTTNNQRTRQYRDLNL